MRVAFLYMSLFRSFLRLLPVVVCLAHATALNGEILTRVADIRALSREAATHAVPVKIRGVIGWRRLGPESGFVIDDGTAGIYVDSHVAIQRGFWKGPEPQTQDWNPGTLVELEGVTDPGGYAPVILPFTMTGVGTAPLPPAHRYATARLLSGNDDSQRVEVDGVVQALSGPDHAGLSTLVMIVDGHPCRVRFERGDELKAESLIDAEIRVRGFLAPMFNVRGEVTGLKIHSMGREDIDVMLPPPADPFAGPRVSVDRLSPFSPTRVPFHRQVTQGTVTFVQPGEFFFLQQGGTGVRVRSGDPVHIDEKVEAAGFVEMTHTLASLGNATVRSLGEGNPPVAERVTINQIIPSKSGGARYITSTDYCGRLVQLEGRLIRIGRNEAGHPVLLWLDSGGRVFSAIPPPTDPNALAWEEGSELALTGVCEIDLLEGPPGENWVTTNGLHLWLRSSADVVVLRSPPWWTAARLRLTLLWAGVAIVLGLVWISLLRWLLRRRTERLEETMQRHRDAELEYASAQRERLRLAVDLHDGIKQHIAVASLRVEAASGHLPSSPETAARHLDSAHAALHRTQTELEECLWGLHAVAGGPPDFVDLLRHVTFSSENWPADTVVIRSHGTPRHLARDVAGSLLLLFQEACGNAFRHGNARLVSVTVHYGADALELRISDDGAGFDPLHCRGPEVGHFGITGMKKRMHWLNGSLQITSRENGGTEVLARLPWPANPAAPT